MAEVVANPSVDKISAEMQKIDWAQRLSYPPSLEVTVPGQGKKEREQPELAHSFGCGKENLVSEHPVDSCATSPHELMEDTTNWCSACWGGGAGLNDPQPSVPIAGSCDDGCMI